MLRSFLIDFNSYFASVEQELRPELRGKPIAVVPVMADTTSCIAASYEAKAFGVKTGTRVGDAKRMCPGLILVDARHDVYVEFHTRCVAAVDSVIPVKKVLSIDEMECELDRRQRTRDAAIALAQSVKRAIYARVGERLRSSVGVGPNRLIAKLASNMQKPDGLTVIEKHELPQRLYGLKVRDITGIGEKMERRLAKLGITSVRALCEAAPHTLRLAWGGVAGEDMHAKLRGDWLEPRDTQTSSISHSHVLVPDLRNLGDAHAVLHRLTQKAAMRLRKNAFYCTRLTLSIKYWDKTKWHADAKFGETQDTAFLLRALDTLWQHVPRAPGGRLTPLAVGMALSGFVPDAAHTPSLFDAEPSRKRLFDAIDQVNKLFGKNTLYFASTHAAKDQAPMRIAFNHIPDLETER